MKSTILTTHRQIVTIMFLDIVGSTAMFAQNDDEELREAFRIFLEDAEKEIRNCGGFVNQVMGDGLMAVFGLGSGYENYAYLASKSARRFKSPLSFRVGIHSGEVIIEHVVSSSGIHRISGETVHIAAKLQAHAKPNQILMTASTFQSLGATGEGDLQSDVLIGAHLFPVYSLRNLIEAALITSPSQSGFIGRCHELLSLREKYFSTHEQGAVVLISGAAGYGKSRLIEELVKGKSEAWNSIKFSFLPFADDINEFFLFILENIIEDIQKYILALPEDVTDPQDLRRDSIFLDALKEIYSANGVSGSWGKLDLTTRQEAKASAVCTLLTRIPKQTIVVIEDAHWGGEIFEKFIQRFIGNYGASNAHIVVTSRNENMGKDFEMRSGTKHIRLGPLKSVEVIELLDEALGTDSSLKKLKAEIATASEGNPLFVHEMMRCLIADGALSGVPHGYWSPKNSVTIKLPETLDAIFEIRFGRLESLDRAILKITSVLGLRFSVNDLEWLADRTGVQLGCSIESLKSEGLLEDVDPLTETYQFTHALIQEAVYKSLLKVDRRYLHDLLFERYRVIKNHPNSRILCGLHAFKAERHPHSYAINFFLGKKELNSSSADRALEYFARALDDVRHMAITPRNRRRYLTCKLHWITALIISDRHDEAVKSYDDLSTELTPDDPKDVLRKIATLNGIILWFTGNLNKAVCFLKSQIHDVTVESAPYHLITNTIRIAGMLVDVGQHEESNKFCSKIVSYFTDKNYSERYGLLFTASSTCYAMMARNDAELGNFDDAAFRGKRAVELAETHGTYLSAVFALVHASMGFINSEKFEMAIPYLTRAHNLCALARTSLLYPLTSTYLAYAYAHVSREKASLRLIQEAQVIASRQNSYSWKSLLHRITAQTYFHLGDHANAAKYGRECQKISKQCAELSNKAYADFIVYSTTAEANSESVLLENAIAVANSLKLKPLIRLIASNPKNTSDAVRISNMLIT